MKKIIAHILILLLMLNMVCCGNNIETENSKTENTSNISANNNSVANNVSVNQSETEQIPITVEEMFEFAKILGPYYEIKDGYIKNNTAVIYSKYEQTELINDGESWKIILTSSSARCPSAICDRMTRLTGDELEIIRQEIMKNSSISLNYFDGYKDGNYYIVYAEYRMYYIKYEEGKYSVISESRIDKNRQKTPEENVYISEGKYADIQYNINDFCLPEDNTKSQKYNEAIVAYNGFLFNKATESLEYLNSGDPYSTEYQTALKDLNNDGIPEMLTVMQFTYPYRVFTYRNGEIVELTGPLSNGMHGEVGLLENNIYYSAHLSTGGESNYVTYNKDGSQTVDIFWSFSDDYPTHYTKYIAWTDEDRWKDTVTVIHDIEYPPTDEGRKQFDEKFKPFAKMGCKTLNISDFDKVYSPYTIDTSVEYSPYIADRIENNYT